MITNMNTPRLYDDLSWIWPLLSPAEHYGEEIGVLTELAREAGIPQGATLLHLGSGGGSADYHLKQSFQVTGVDLSPKMLALAKELNPEVRYEQGDMRTVRLGTTFDVVLLHDAQSYLTTPEDLQAAYDTVAAHLRPGGVLLSTPETLRHLFEQHEIGENETLSDGERTVTTIEVHFDPDPSDHSHETTYLYLIRDASGQRVEMDVHQHGLWDLEEVLAPLRKMGFEPETRTPKLSDLEEGEWVVVVGRKPG